MNLSEINTSLYYTLLPAAAITVFLMSALVVFCGRVIIYGMPSTDRVEQRGHSPFIGKLLMEYWFWLFKPLERTIVKVRISPDAVTVFGTMLAGAAGVAFYNGYFVAGGWLMIFGGTMDILDGAVARALNMQSKAGAFLDSTLDRYAELFSLGGLVCYYSGTPFVTVVFMAVLGSTLVSYTRARAEASGVEAKMGNMQRAERVMYIGIGTAFSPVVANIFEPGAAKPMFYLAMIAISIVAFFSNTTALRRLFYTYKTLKNSENESPRQ
jgi:phosphatidylglycerophosphate synthase